MKRFSHALWRVAAVVALTVLGLFEVVSARQEQPCMQVCVFACNITTAPGPDRARCIRACVEACHGGENTP